MGRFLINRGVVLLALQTLFIITQDLLMSIQ